MTIKLPDDLLVRAPTMADLEAVAALMNACDIAEHGEPDTTPEDIGASWQSPEFNLGTDAWLVVAPGAGPVGYAAVYNRRDVRLHAGVHVHPEHRGRGIWAHLLQLTEERARRQADQAPPDAGVSLYNSISNADDAARRILEGAGYTLARHFWRMRIEMSQAPPAPVWPDGISTRTFAPGHDERATFDAMEEAFQDHWGYAPWRFEAWQQLTIGRADFDPGLCFLAMDGAEIAGGSLCRSYPDEGWVSQLGVRRRWRRRGLGLALLRHTLAEFYKRNQARVSLQVDSQNTTGATRLYERAGMCVARQFDRYEKVLRDRSES